MQLYGIPNCNTVKKARDWLNANQIAYEFHDFKKLGIDEATIQDWMAQYPWKKLVNRAGLTWRGLNEAVKSSIQDIPSAIALMQAKPSLIKRPLLVKDGKILALGFDEKLYKEICLP